MIRVLISFHSPTTYPQTKLARSMSLHRSQRETDHWAIPAPFGALGLRAGGTGQGTDGIRRGWKGNGDNGGCPTLKEGHLRNLQNHCNWVGGLEEKVARCSALRCLQQEIGFTEKGVFRMKM